MDPSDPAPVWVAGHDRLRALMQRRGLGALLLRRPANLALYMGSAGWKPSGAGAKVEETFERTVAGTEVVAGAAAGAVA